MIIAIMNKNKLIKMSFHSNIVFFVLNRKEKDLAMIAMDRMEEMEVRRKGVMISDVWKKPKKIVIDYHALSDIEEVDEEEEEEDV